MFKVMCVKPFSGNKTNDGGFPDPTMPEILTTYTQIDELSYEGSVYLVLAEYGNNYAWSATHFATLPEETATEMYEQEIEAIIK